MATRERWPVGLGRRKDGRLCLVHEGISNAWYLIGPQLVFAE